MDNPTNKRIFYYPFVPPTFTKMSECHSIATTKSADRTVALFRNQHAKNLDELGYLFVVPPSFFFNLI